MNDLQPNSEEELILASKNGSDEATKRLIEMHSGIFVEMSKRYIRPDVSPHLVVDDVVSSKDYVIYKSIESFDSSKGSKFSTWLANQTKFYCLNKINKYKKQPILTNLCAEDDFSEDPINNFSTEDKEDENKEALLDKIRLALNLIKNQKVKNVIFKKYFSETKKPISFTEIAKEMDVSVQTVINWHNKFIDFAKKICLYS
jgi:RNA polymerase sigma factor (sigma-70 family)